MRRHVTTRVPIQSDETLRECLEALGMNATELVRRITVPVHRITEVLSRAISGDSALRLLRFFGATGRFWLNLQ